MRYILVMYTLQDVKKIMYCVIKCVIYIIVNNILVFHEYFAISYFIYYIETYNVRLRRFLLYNKTLCTYEEMNVPDLAVYKGCLSKNNLNHKNCNH